MYNRRLIMANVVGNVALIALIVMLSSVNAASSFADKSSIRILYGSCHSTQLRSPLWPLILERKPDVWIFGGDNMYSDRMLKDPLQALLHLQLPFIPASEEGLIESYRDLHEDPGYKSLVDSGVEQISMWDDHDYGISESTQGLVLHQL